MGPLAPNHPTIELRDARLVRNRRGTLDFALALGSAVLANHIVNYSANAAEQSLILHTTVTIGYDVPWRKVHELLLRAAGTTKGLLAEPAPFMLQTALDDFYVHYQINGYCSEPQRMAAIYSELYQNIQDEFAKAGVEIMSPHYFAARDGNAVNLPPDHLPAGYQAPAFRVQRAGP